MTGAGSAGARGAEGAQRHGEQPDAWPHRAQRHREEPDAHARIAPGWLRDLAGVARRMPVSSHLRPPQAGGRSSAVLVLFGEGHAGTDVLLTQRSSGLRRHAGQVAFPGGAIDPSDAGPVAAALREAAEETGLDPAGVGVVGVLPELFVARSGFRVIPVLAWWWQPSPVGPANPSEVAAVARISLSDLSDPANRFTVRHPSGFAGPAFRVGNMLIWGFTAGILDSLLALGGWERPWDASRVQALPTDVLG